MRNLLKRLKDQEINKNARGENGEGEIEAIEKDKKTDEERVRKTSSQSGVCGLKLSLSFFT